MAEPLTREEFLIHFGYLRDDLVEVKAQLTRLNGRTGKAEDNIATLNVDVAVLQDRSPAGRGTAAAWGGGIAGAVIALVEAVKMAWGK